MSQRKERGEKDQSLAINTEADSPCIIVISPMSVDGRKHPESAFPKDTRPGRPVRFSWDESMPGSTEQQRERDEFRLGVFPERGGSMSFVVKNRDGLKELTISAKHTRGPFGETLINVEPKPNLPESVKPLGTTHYDDFLVANYHRNRTEEYAVAALGEIEKGRRDCRKDLPLLPCDEFKAFKEKESESLPFLGELFIVNKESVPLALYIRNPMTEEDLLVTPYLPPDGGVVRTSWTALKNAPVVEFTLKTLSGIQLMHGFTMNSWDAISTVAIGGTKELPPKISLGGDYKLANGRIVRRSFDMIRDAMEAANVRHSTKINAALQERLEKSIRFLRDPEGKIRYHGDKAVAPYARTHLEFVNNGSHDTFVILVSRKTGRKLLSVDVAAKQVYRTSWSVLGAGELVEGDPLDLKVSNGEGMPQATYNFDYDPRTHTLMLDQKPGDTRISVQAFPSIAKFSRYPDDVPLYEREIADLTDSRLRMHYQSLRPPILPFPELAKIAFPDPLSDEQIFHNKLSASIPRLAVFNNLTDMSFVVIELETGRTSPAIDLKRGQYIITSWYRFANRPPDLALVGVRLQLSLRLATGESRMCRIEPLGWMKDLVFDATTEGEITCTAYGEDPRRNRGGNPSSRLTAFPFPVSHEENAGHRKILLAHRAARYFREPYEFVASSTIHTLDGRVIPEYKPDQFVPPLYPSRGLQPQPRKAEASTGIVEQQRGGSLMGLDYVTINSVAGGRPSFVFQVGEASGCLSGYNLYRWPHRVKFDRSALFDDGGFGENVTFTVLTDKTKASTYHFKASNDLDEIRIGAQDGENPTVELHFFKWKPGFKRELVSPSERLQLEQKANLRRADEVDQTHLAWLSKPSDDGTFPQGLVRFTLCTNRGTETCKGRGESISRKKAQKSGGEKSWSVTTRKPRGKNGIAVIRDKDSLEWRRQNSEKNKSLSATTTEPRKQTPTAVNKAKNSQDRRQRRFAGESSTPSSPARSRNTEDWRSFPMHLLNDSVVSEEAMSKTVRESGTSRSGSTNAATSNNTGLLPLYASASLLQAVIDGFLPQPQLLR